MQAPTYDVNTDLVGTTLGIGLAYDIASKFRARVGFDWTGYEETEIDATLGTRHDKTLVEPESESFYLSIQYQF
jgi:opacity protein-like surface antigen